MKISIVIPAYNEERYIKDCLSSIEKNLVKDICEVIVVDNGSTDYTSRITQQFPFVTVLYEPRKGNSRARQKGLLSAKGDLVAFIDADTHITKDWTQIAFSEFTHNKNLVALSGPGIFYDLNGWYSIFISIYFNILLVPLSKITHSVALCGNLVVRKDAIISIGGFDTTIEFYGDDTNIIRRLKEVGQVVFKTKFLVYTSARRLKREGIIKTGFTYALNFFSEKFFHTQITKKYLDIR